MPGDAIFATQYTWPVVQHRAMGRTLQDAEPPEVADAALQLLERLRAGLRSGMQCKNQQSPGSMPGIAHDVVLGCTRLALLALDLATWCTRHCLYYCMILVCV